MASGSDPRDDLIAKTRRLRDLRKPIDGSCMDWLRLYKQRAEATEKLATAAIEWLGHEEAVADGEAA